MGGLERITGEIIEEARREAERILRKADNEAEKIAAAGRAEAEKRRAEATRETAQELGKRRAMAAASSRQERRQILLQTRMEAIREAVATAKHTIYTMEGQPYFELLMQLFRNYAQEEDGVILFSERDLARMPDGFIEKLNGTLERGSVALGTQPADIEYGFIIRYGDIEQNCCIESIFEEKKNVLEDRINRCFEDGVDA